MRFFKRLFAKERYPDGSVLWPSGKEHFSFIDQHGNRIEFDVLYTDASAGASNMIVGSSFSTSDGASIAEETKEEIIAKSRIYFAERGQQVVVV